MHSNRVCFDSSSFRREPKMTSNYSKQRSPLNTNKEIGCDSQKNYSEKKKEWNDIRFDKEFWRNSPAFRRPNQELAIKAGIHFVFLYRNGNGTREDWENVMTILLLYMRFSGEYVIRSRPGNEALPALTVPGSNMFNKDMKFVGSRGKNIIFRTERETKLIDAEMCSKWATNILEQLNSSNVNIDIYLYYLGFLCLYMLRLMVAPPIFVEQDIMKTCLWELKRTWFRSKLQTGFNFTPPPHADAYLKLQPALARGNYFRDMVLIWFQSSLIADRAKSSFLNRIITNGCFDVLQTSSLGVFAWLLNASVFLRVPCYRLLYLMDCEMRIESQILRTWNFLKRCNDKDQKRRSWQVSRLLDSSVHRELSAKHNRFCTGVLIILATGSTKLSDEIWKMQHLHKLEIDQKFFNLILESAQKVQARLKLAKYSNSITIEDSIKVPVWMTSSIKSADMFH